VGLARCGTVFPVSAVVGAAVPVAVCRLGAVSVLSWCGEVSRGGIQSSAVWRSQDIPSLQSFCARADLTFIASHTCNAHIRQYHCKTIAQYTNPPPESEILVMAISCKDQTPVHDAIVRVCLVFSIINICMDTYIYINK